jgi:DNA repair photolyase
VQDAFGIVLVVVVVVAALIAVAAFVGTGRAYEQIGRGGLSIGDRVAPPMPGERDAELRQMLEARSARRVRKGGEPLDIDAELAALTRPAADPALAAEIRGLVEARNARRVRQGKEPLDVEAEVARRMRDLADG